MDTIISYCGSVRGIRATRLQHRQLTVEELFEFLATPDIRNNKEGPYFIYASFTKPKRLAVNIDKYHGAVIDIDDADVTMKSIRRTYRRYTHCIYTTFNHRAPGKGRRYRVVIPYEQPVSPKRHKVSMAYLTSKLGKGNFDGSSSALSRGMYLPSCPQSRKKRFKLKINKTNKFFKLTPKIEFEAQELLDDDERDQERFDVKRETHDGNRNSALSQYVGQLINEGKSLEQALMSTHGYNEVKVFPSLPRKDVDIIVKSVFRTHKSKSGDGDWGFAEILRQIENAKPRDLTVEYKSHVKRIAKSTKKIDSADREALLARLAEKSRLGRKVITGAYKVLRGQATIDETEKKHLSKKELLDDISEKFKNYVYVSVDDRVYDTRKGINHKREAFNTKYAGTFDKGSLINELISFNKIPHVDKKEYYPRKKRLYKREGVDYVNTYRKPRFKSKEGSIKPLLKHLKYILPDKRERGILLDTIAFLKQKPGKKMNWMLVIKGEEGIGKSIIAERVIQRILGPSNVRLPDSEMVKSSFNSWMLNAQVLVFNELMLGETRKEKRALTRSLNSLITEPTIEAHTKGIDPYSVINCVNVIGFTNHEDALMMSNTDRRFCMLRSDAHKKDKAYYAKLRKWCWKHRAELSYYFENRDISEFNYVHPPETAYTQEIKSESIMWPGSILQNALIDNRHIFNTDGACPWDVIADYVYKESKGSKDQMRAQNIQGETASSGYLLANALKDLGFRKFTLNEGSAQQRLRIRKKLQSVWIAPKFVRKYKKYNLKQIRHVFRNQRLTSDFD